MEKPLPIGHKNGKRVRSKIRTLYLIMLRRLLYHIAGAQEGAGSDGEDNSENKEKEDNDNDLPPIPSDLIEEEDEEGEEEGDLDARDMD